MAANVCNLESFFGGYISILPTGMITKLGKEEVSSSVTSKCPVSPGMVAEGRVPLIKLQASKAMHSFPADWGQGFTFREIFTTSFKKIHQY